MAPYTPSATTQVNEGQGFMHRGYDARRHCNTEIPNTNGYIFSVGIYNDDTEALLAGNSVGDWYELSQFNSYGMAAGTLKRIVEEP